MAAQPRVLVVEDDLILSEVLDLGLQSAGYAVVGPVPSNAEAECLIRGGGIHLAVVDYMLADGPAHSLIEKLGSADIPFVIYSGSDPSVVSPRLPPGTPWVAKGEFRLLLRELGHLLGAFSAQGVSDSTQGVSERV